VASYRLWLIFLSIIFFVVAMETWRTARNPHSLSTKEAIRGTVVWILFSLGFGAFIWRYFGAAQGWEFFTAYLVEKSLSLDNLFIFLLLFRYFGVDDGLQPYVLAWGVAGALVMRGVLIVAGNALLLHFHWVAELFGLLLLYAAFMLLRGGMSRLPAGENRILRWIRGLVPVTSDFHGNKFFVRTEGARRATPLLIALISIELADLVFAMDSIPAAFSITRNVFLVFSSNACAVLGLRAIYFLLPNLLGRLRYMGKGMGGMLFFLGGKMLAARWVEISAPFSLLVICGILLMTVLFSLIRGGFPDSMGGEAGQN
jgi:tellurite resistance protein TerC